MGIFLTPRGRAEAVTPREACDRALAWFERNEGDRVMSLESSDDAGGSASLFVVLHPAADAVRITWSAQGDVEADAKTSREARSDPDGRVIVTEEAIRG